MDADVVIRGGSVVDGTGAPSRRADVAVAGERIVAVEPDFGGTAARTIDATGKVVTPGFVDIHTHLDAQLAWDHLGTSSCWHGITSVVLGNCGVTFAPVNPGDREMLAEMMESVEDIPRRAILEGLPWDWSTYGEYLGFLDRLPKGLNVGGMVGHSAVRVASMGERSLDDVPARADDITAMCEHVEEAMRAGALGFSTSRTLGHRVPDGRPVPGTWATPDELIAIGDVMGRLGRGVFESASRLGERDGDDLAGTRAELAWMGEVSRRSGRPLSFGLAQSNRRPDLYREVVEMAKEQNALGANVRPQTTTRGIGILTTLDNRTPFDRSAPWAALRGLPLADKLAALRERRDELIAAGTAEPGPVPMEHLWVLMPGAARYDCRPDATLAAVATRRGVSAVEAFIDLCIETDGRVLLNYPILNQSLGAVEAMLDDPLVTLGLADAGAHVGQIMDASQPTFFLTYWVRERQRWTLEDAIRRLTSDTAGLFGIRDRGVLRAGAFADVNVIDFDGLALPIPEYVHDFPNGAGRYVQRASGYDCTLVNGEVFMEGGEHTGVLAGHTLRSTD